MVTVLPSGGAALRNMDALSTDKYIQGVFEIKCKFLRKHRKRKDRKKIFYKDFNKDVADSNTLLMTLVLILVSHGKAVLDDGGDDHVQPGLAIIYQPSSHIF